MVSMADTATQGVYIDKREKGDKEGRGGRGEGRRRLLKCMTREKPLKEHGMLDSKDSQMIIGLRKAC
jgi:hypothetical protein